MKSFGLFALAVLLSPSMALAQSSQGAPPMTSPDGGPPPGGMQQMRAQTAQLRMETRSQMLAALTSQHLALLGSVIGRLATSPTPDLQAAAQQLDAALTPRESQSIVAAATAMRDQMRGGMQNGGMQNGGMQNGGMQNGGMPNGGMPNGGPPNAGPDGAMDHPPMDAPPAHAPDPGMALLRAALAVGGATRPGRGQ